MKNLVIQRQNIQAKMRLILSKQKPLKGRQKQMVVDHKADASDDRPGNRQDVSINNTTYKIVQIKPMDTPLTPDKLKKSPCKSSKQTLEPIKMSLDKSKSCINSEARLL